jgi:pimeloyl-ACP methyl ester carboxylesterase
MNGLWNETPQYRSNGVPAIVIGGDKDTVFSVAEQRAVADAIPGATFVLLPDVGHGVHWEDPRVLASVFYDSNRPGR